ncbi:MAG: dienelactone hydrolase family protein [Pseudomonadota bacterium]
MRQIFIGFLFACIATTAQAGETVAYSANGADYEGYYAKAAGTSKGLVLVIHDWDGLTGYEVQRADMLAKLGYDAFAVDLYGKGNRPTETGAKKAETRKLYNDRAKMRALILAGLDEARKRNGGSVVVMGYCFGGAATLELARSGKATDVKGFATFHGGLKTPKGQSYAKGTAPILIAHGGADAGIPMDDVAQLSKELESAGVTYDIEVYSGAPHAFTVIGSGRYRERADRKSWSAFTEFLKENLG